jgi:hypothetical protein
MQGKLKYQKTDEEEAEREDIFNQMDVNHNRYISLAELDKALPNIMGCTALFNAKPVIIRAFLAATGRPPTDNEHGAYRRYAKDYVQAGEQFRVLMQYLHEYFELYLIFQDMADADEDRRIDCAEWAKFIESGNAEKIGIEVTPELLEDKCGDTPMPGYSLFNQIDTDQGGCVLFKEFSDFCIRKSFGGDAPIGWAGDEQDEPGQYFITIDGTWVGSSPDEINHDAGKIYRGTVVEVTEIVNLEERCRIRAKIDNPEGWISLTNTSTGKRWAAKATKSRDLDELVGPEQANVKLRSLFGRVKDTPAGISVDRFKVCLGKLGMDEEHVNTVAEEVDKNASGVIEPNEFIDWLWFGDMGEEERGALASMC